MKKISIKTQNVILALVIAFAFITVLFSFNSEPDFVLMKINGYKFGVNWTSYTYLKLALIGSMLLLGIARQVIEDDVLEKE